MTHPNVNYFVIHVSCQTAGLNATLPCQIWTFCGRAANKETNRVHKRALRILLKDSDASFDEMLIRNDEKLFTFRILRNS